MFGPSLLSVQQAFVGSIKQPKCFYGVNSTSPPLQNGYQFKCLPFGLCTVPRVLAKTLKPVVEMSRFISIRLVIYIYIDDMLLIAPSS